MVATAAVDRSERNTPTPQAPNLDTSTKFRPVFRVMPTCGSADFACAPRRNILNAVSYEATRQMASSLHKLFGVLKRTRGYLAIQRSLKLLIDQGDSERELV